MSGTGVRHVLRTLPATTAIVATACLSLLATTVPGPSFRPVLSSSDATHLVITQVPTTADPGDDFAGSSQPKVEVRDADDNVVDSAVPVVLSLEQVGTDLSGTLACDDLSVVPSSGVAAFAGCAISKGGSYHLKATSTGLTSATSGDVFVSGPAKVLFSGQPGGGSAGATWASQPQLSVVDGNGVVLTSDTHDLGVAILPGSGAAGATLTCTDADRKMAAVDGVVTFAGCGIDKAATGYKLVGVDLTDKVYGTSTAFAITAGTASQIAFTTQPSGGAGGVALPTQPVVAVQDAHGNTITGSTDAITLTLTPGTGTSGAALSCTAPVSAISGLATFSGCAVDLTGTAYTITATDSTISQTATSQPFAVGAGVATHLVFSHQPSGGAAGAAFGTQPAVTLADAGGNAKSGTVTLSLTGGTAGAVLTCSANPQSAVNAPAGFTGCAVDRPGTGYVLHAASGALSHDSHPFDVTVGGVASLVFSTSPDTTAGGASFSHQPVVQLLDAGGNPAAGSVTLSITDGTGSPDAALGCASSTVAAVNGVATFSGCDIDLAAAGYSLTATSGTVHGLSTRFDITTGAAARLRFVTQPGDGTGGSALATQPVVEVQDLGGNPIPGDATSITLAVTPGTGAGSLTCSSNPQPVVRGAAAFQVCAIDRTASAYRLTATDSAHHFTVNSDTFAVTAGPAATLLFTASPKTAVAGQLFSTTPTVVVADKGGNPVAGAPTVTLALTPGSGTPAGQLGCADLTQSDGTFEGCSIGTAAGGYSLTATGAGRTAESPSFPVVQAPPVPLEQAPTAVPVPQTLGRLQYAKNPTAVSDFVNSATGELLWDTTDLTVAGVGKPLDLTRTYNSLDGAVGLFGQGWSSVLDLSVTFGPGGTTATVRGEDGQRVGFTLNPVTGAWVGAAGARATLKCSAKTCTVTRFDGTTWDVSGSQLLDYRDANGQGLTFGYTGGKLSSIKLASTNSTNRTVTVTTNAAGHVTKLQTPTRSVSYGYTGNALTSFTDARGKTWHYGYAGGLLTTITDPLGHDRLVVAYDGTTHRVAALSAKGDPRHLQDTFSWDAGAQRSTRTATTSVDGALTQVDYVDTYKGNVLVRQDLPTGATMRYSHDARLNLVAVQDPHGWVEQLTYSAANDLIEQATPITSTSSANIRFTFDNDHRMLSQTDANGNRTDYVYNGPNLGGVTPPGPGSTATKLVVDTKGLVTSMTNAIGKQLFSYDAFGNRTVLLQQSLPGSALNGKGTLSTYDEAGHQLTFVDARGTTRNQANAFKTTWAYDAAGNLLSTSSPTGSTSTSYDDAGDAVASTDAAGVTSHVAWDEGDLTRTTTTPTGTLTQVFDPSGNVLTESSGGGGTTEHRYDGLGRETTTTSPAGIVTRLSYDGIGNVIGLKDTAGNTLTRQYDSRSLLVRQVDNGEDTRTSYDRAGNTTSYRDASGATTTRTYDAHNNVATVTDAAGTTSYAYDRADNVISRTDGRGNTTTFTYDGMARLLTTTTGGRTWTNTYDEAGNRVTTTDPDGRKTSLTLDAANRATKTDWTQSGKPTITVTEAYNGLGRRTAMTDSTGTHSYAYDAAGRLTSGEGFTYSYDAGEVTTTYPDGTHVVTALDDTGAVMDVTSGTPGTAGYVRAAYLRDAARRTTGIAFANGVLDTRRTDAAGNVLSDTLQRAGTTLASDVYSYDSGGNRLSQVHTAAGAKVTSTYGYDGANRLTGFKAVSEAAALPPLQTAAVPSASGGTVSGGLAPPLPDPEEPTASGLPAPPTAYGYDAVGNRTSWTTAGGTRTASHNALDQAVTEGGTGGAATRTFDLSGNETKLVTAAFTRTSTYDAASRLVSVVTTGAGAGTVTYTYDGDGNRITRTTGGATTKLVWDKRGDLPQLVLERTSSNALIRRYINGEGPVAMQTPTATFFFHLDPMGSVTELSDASGNVVAGYSYDGFGQVTTTGAGGATPPVNPLLFQGQLLDQSTGLYYMRARDYDPTSGRFTRGEPLATPTGRPQVSPYAFVNDRPTVWSDPSGLTPLAERIFAGQASDDANIANNTKYAATGALIAVKAVAKLGGFAGAAKAAAAEGGAATTASKVGNGLKFAGVALAVIGLGLQTYVTVETCLHGTVQACVGATVGLAVSVGFFAGCTALTAGAGAVVCGIVGGVLSMALQFVITEYGPAIVDGLIELGNLTAAAMTTAWLATAEAFTSFGNDVAQATLAAIDGLVSGFNAGLAAVASGFQSALDVLVDAGYTALQLATVLADTFEQGAREAIAGLIDLGYAIADLAETVKDVFNQTALQAAKLFKDAFDYTATQVMGLLNSAYGLAQTAAAEIVKAVDFAVAQVAAALESVYHLAADTIAGVLQDVAYTVNQIGAVLKDVLHQADLALTQILKDLSYTVQQVAGVLRDVLAKVDQAAAQLLQGVTFLATEIATALKEVYDAAIQRVGQVLKNIGVAVTQVATALATAFTAAAAAVAQVLKNIAFTVTQVGEALRDAFSQVAGVAVQVLQQIGYLASEVATALKDAFAQVDAAVASLLKSVGYLADQVAGALQTVFTLGAQAVAQLLKNVNYLIGEVTQALQSVFAATAQVAAQILKNISYAIAEIAGVLQSFFAEAAAAAAQILENIGYAFAEIGSVLQSVFNAAADAVVSILKDIGAAASEIATILGNVFGLAVDAIAGFLSSVFSSNTIAAIGGAFEDFGNAVADFFSDLF